MFSSLIAVIAFINETQVYIYDNSNFIYNPLIFYKYVHSKSVKSEAQPL